MKTFKQMILAASLVAGLGMAGAAPAIAGPNDPLFVNLISDEGHRAGMALTFSGRQLKLGHPLTIFLNDRAVALASRANAGKYPEQQKALAELIATGATIIVCPMCMKHYGVAEADLLPGLKLSNAELISGQLFRDNTRTLTW